MPHGSSTPDHEINEAAWIATRGAAVGAAKWGIFSTVAAGAGYAYSPLFRGLTLQFKVFLVIAGMSVGGMIEADSRLRTHERYVRRQRAVARDAKVWKEYERDYLARAGDASVQEQSE